MRPIVFQLAVWIIGTRFVCATALLALSLLVSDTYAATAIDEVSRGLVGEVVACPRELLRGRSGQCRATNETLEEVKRATERLFTSLEKHVGSDPMWTKSRGKVRRRFFVWQTTYEVVIQPKKHLLAVLFVRECSADESKDASSSVDGPKVKRETQVKPKWPDLVQFSNIEGSVIIRGILNEDGQLENMCIVESNDLGFGFEEAALDAVSQWVFDMKPEWVSLPRVIHVDFKTPPVQGQPKEVLRDFLGVTGDRNQLLPDPEDRRIPLAVGEGGVTMPMLTPETKIKPDYPAIGVSKRLEAGVVVLVIIRSDGSVAVEGMARCAVRKRGKKLKPKLERHCPAFWRSAVEAVSQWNYDPPPMLDGVAVDAYWLLFVQFEFD